MNMNENIKPLNIKLNIKNYANTHKNLFVKVYT